jgi:hypothetical protein
MKDCIDWNGTGEDNPLDDFQCDPMVHVLVIDHLAYYLQHHLYHAPAMCNRTLIIPPSLYRMAAFIPSTQSTSAAPSTNDDIPAAVWLPSILPTYLILPVVEYNQGGLKHWYLLHGKMRPSPQPGTLGFIELYLLDSLGKPSKPERTHRLQATKRVIERVFPNFSGHIVIRYQQVDDYKQAPGSLDCGIFCSQAMSAIAFEQPAALDHLLPVSEVRNRIANVLLACKRGVLEQIAMGHTPSATILLHHMQGTLNATTKLESNSLSYPLKNMIPMPCVVLQASLRQSSQSFPTNPDKSVDLLQHPSPSPDSVQPQKTPALNHVSSVTIS